jgi:hypothetical protein
VSSSSTEQTSSKDWSVWPEKLGIGPASGVSGIVLLPSMT